MTGFHESHKMGKDEWLTPPWLLARLGTFDLDPCAPSGDRRPWDTARKHYCVEDNGLNQPWAGRVWLNPPYGREMSFWLKRLAAHGNGIALIFARTDTEAFFEQVWDRSDAVLFLRKRLFFHHVDGRMATTSAGAASVLIAYGAENVESLRACSDLGCFIPLRDVQAA
jgi:hypothetical protein